MLIRTQDEECIINFERVEVILIQAGGPGGGYKVNGITGSGQYMMLGFYKTRGSAKRVMDMISISYQEGTAVYQMPEE